MHKIAVVGSYDSIYGFAALGLSVFPAETGQEVRDTLKALAARGYGIIYLTEEAAASAPEAAAAYEGAVTPAVILIPGVKGNTGAGIQGVKDSVEKAVGSDILFGSED